MWCSLTTSRQQQLLLYQRGSTNEYPSVDHSDNRSGVLVYRCIGMVYNACAETSMGMARHGSVAAIADDQWHSVARDERRALKNSCIRAQLVG